MNEGMNETTVLQSKFSEKFKKCGKQNKKHIIHSTVEYDSARATNNYNNNIEKKYKKLHIQKVKHLGAVCLDFGTNV